MLRFDGWVQFFGVLLTLIFFPAELRSQQPTLGDVLASTPDRANAILYIDAPSVREFTAGMPLHDDLNANLGEVRIAAELNLNTFEPTWEIGYATVKELPDIASLSKSVEGIIDTIAGKSVVWSPRKSYLVPLPENLLGVVRPSDRKLVARWLKKEKGQSYSAYLDAQAKQGTQFVSVLLAIDLEDIWSPMAIMQRVETLESLKTTDLKAMTATLSTIRGIRILVSRKNLDDCIISIDFGTSPTNLLPVAKDFFIEVLERNQSSVPEAAKWTPSISENTLSFRGTISPATLDDMLGLFTLQRQASTLPGAKAKPTLELTTRESSIIDTSKAYFGKTQSIIKRVRDYSADGTGDRASWNGKMATRIDELPTLNVDPELVDFAAKVAKGLRNNMVVLQQTNIAYGTNATVNAGGSYGDGYGGYYDGNAPYQYRAMARGHGNTAYRTLIANIDQMEAEIRRKMTEKHQVQF